MFCDLKWQLTHPTILQYYLVGIKVLLNQSFRSMNDKWYFCFSNFPCKSLWVHNHTCYLKVVHQKYGQKRINDRYMHTASSNTSITLYNISDKKDSSLAFSVLVRLYLTKKDHGCCFFSSIVALIITCLSLTEIKMI